MVGSWHFNEVFTGPALLAGDLLALATRTKLAEVFEAVDPGPMSVTPFKLKRVLADQFDLAKFQIVRNMNGKDDAHSGHLILAGSAWTHATKHGSEMMG